MQSHIPVLTLAVIDVGSVSARHTITCDNNELIVLGDVVNGHVWEGCHDLLLWGQLGALLKLKVANGAGKCEVAVHATKVNEATSGANSSFLGCEELARCPKSFRSSCTDHRFAACGQRKVALPGL